MRPSPERIDRLQQQWWNLLRPSGAEPSAIYSAFDALATRHSEPHRHYHTLEHIAEMLRLIPRLTPAGADPFPTALAVWFHDAVYDPEAGDNEVRSAELATDVLTRLAVPVEAVVFAAELIRSTDHRNHVADDSRVEFAILHDADLAILGSAPARYDRYAADIRREYVWVPQDDYRIGRSRVLRTFLDRSRIYFTPLLFEEGEAFARENLTRELASLR